MPSANKIDAAICQEPELQAEDYFFFEKCPRKAQPSLDMFILCSIGGFDDTPPKSENFYQSRECAIKLLISNSGVLLG